VLQEGLWARRPALRVPSDALARAFFDRPALEVAPELLGAHLVAHHGEGVVVARITEVEAYEGPDDPAAHTYRGPTATNRTEFGPPGTFYIYRHRGIHHCLNITCGPGLRPVSVLLRAAEIVLGDDMAKSRRGSTVRERDLARGPANLARSLGVADLRHNGADACNPQLALYVAPGRIGEGPVRACSGPRVGVAGTAGLFPWRFWICKDPTVSAYPAHPSLRRMPSTDTR
jgi:DNA-3-methyladenine glycosylase